MIKIPTSVPNPRTGTIFQGSQLPLSKHYMAMFLLSTSKKITAVELSKRIGVSEKTAYEILRKLKFMDLNLNIRLFLVYII